MEVTKLVRRGDEGTSVNQDAESWSKLVPEICDMILEKLPCIERVRLRVVCKDWNCSEFQRVEPKPYFVTILRSTISFQYLSGLVVYDVVSKSLSFEPLPFKLHLPCNHGYYHSVPFAVQGLIFTNQPMSRFKSKRWWSDDGLEDVRKHQWCVYNIHTRTRHLLPRAPGCYDGERYYFCGMMVDTSTKPHSFKLLTQKPGKKMQIYDSATRSWSSHPKSNPNSKSLLLANAYKSDWYFCMCHKGCMYMSGERAVDGVLVYSMEEDQWSKLSGSPFRGEKRPFLGAWDDRIFAVLHDAGAESVTVWELIDSTEQEWVEYAGCSKAQYEQLMKHDKYVEECNCEIMSIFSKEYVLMYNWHAGQSYALVMLNLRTREWEPVASIPKMIDETVNLLEIERFKKFLEVAENRFPECFFEYNEYFSTKV